MNHIGLFEGIGGFSLPAEWMGWDTIAYCEINPFCQKVLKYHFPKANLHEDIKTTDFTIYRGKCDIVTGGFPCQPYSIAGKRKGKEDDRHLWPEMLRAVREIQPSWVVGENVSGLTNWNGGMVFNEVQADLEAEGYEILPFLLPACAVNAPHRRERIWFIAYNKNVQRYRDNRRCGGLSVSQSMEVEESERLCCQDNENREGIQKPFDAQNNNKCSRRGGSRSYKQEQIRQSEMQSKDCKPLGKQPQQREGERSNEAKGSQQMVCSNLCKQREDASGVLRYERGSIRSEGKSRNESGSNPNSNSNGQYRSNREHEEQPSERREYAQRNTKQMGGINATNTKSIGEYRTQELENNSGQSGERRRCDIDNACEVPEQDGSADAANANGRRQPCEEYGQEKSGRIAKTGIPNDWSNFPTQSALCSRNDGIPPELVGITFPKHRNESIKSYGNAVVPAVVYEIYKAIQSFENLNIANHETINKRH